MGGFEQAEWYMYLYSRVRLGRLNCAIQPKSFRVMLRNREHGRVDLRADERGSAEVGGAGEGRDRARRRRHRQRLLGPLGQDREEASLETARRHDPTENRLPHRLPVVIRHPFSKSWQKHI